jgi:hypothetical protein
VKIFVDEDTGAPIAKALRLVRVLAWCVGKKERFRSGTKDRDWIPDVTGDNRLIISRNSQMLDDDYERALLIQHNAAIVYFPQPMSPLNLLKLILIKRDWLTRVYENDPRPFAYKVTLGGLIIPIDVHNYVPRRERVGWPVPPPRKPRGGRQSQESARQASFL